MNKPLLLRTTLLLFFIAFSACKKDKHTSAPEPTPVEDPEPAPGVYLAGAKQSGSNYYNAILYLGKDDGRQALTTEGNQADVSDMTVWAENLYVSGWETIGTSNGFGGKNGVAKYWKMDTAFNLTDGSKNAQALGIAVNDGIVYVCGFESNATTSPTKRLACYWKDGEQYFLPEVDNQQNPSCIAVQGTDVYIGGSEDSRDYAGPFPYIHDQPLYWKNGTAINLPKKELHAAYPMDIAVSGNDVYIAGHGKIYSQTDRAKEFAVYWKNNEITVLTDGNTDARAYGIFLDGQDVYVCGWDNNMPCYWKNGSKVELKIADGANYGQAYSICVVGNNVYVAGLIDDAGVYWKNGELVTVADLSRINDIWVVEK